jgi:integrase
MEMACTASMNLVGRSPKPPPLLERLADRARGYVEAASSTNTRKAYASDWKHFAAWCRRSNLSSLPPNPQTVGLYITACASGTVERGATPNSVSTIQRRLSSLSWSYAQRVALDRRDRHIATVMAGIRNSHAKPPVQKEAVMAADIVAMLETLDRSSALFRRVTGQGKLVGAERLNDKEIARLVKRVAMAAGVRGDLSEEERVLKFSGHSLRAGLASSAEVDERYVQKQLGHASAEMTRRYQRRRDRFRINLTKAAGL